MKPLKIRFKPGESTSQPVVLLVHGRAGHLGVMSVFERVLPKEFGVLHVEAPYPDSIGGWSWWDIDQSSEKQQEQRVIAHQLIKATISELFSESSKNLIAIGFSQGGAILADCITRSIIEPLGLALLSSFLLKESTLLNYKVWKGLCVFSSHGEKDQAVPFARCLEDREMLQRSGAILTTSTEQVGHKLGKDGMTALKGWIQQFSPATT